MSGEDIVESGYDRLADAYLDARDRADPELLANLDAATRPLSDGSRALDLGCGAGIPVTQWLARRFVVTGVDISARQLELARTHAPEATVIKASMIALVLPAATFDVVVAIYSIIHVPRAEQPALLRCIHEWLRAGGVFVAPWAIHAWEGREDDWEGWGAPMWWSHVDAATNLRLLQEVGFRIESARTRTSGTETWLWVVARA